MKYSSLNSKEENKSLIGFLQIINMCIGSILTLLCILIYITVESNWIRSFLAITLVIATLIFFIKLLQTSINKGINNSKIINKISLVNENNEIIKEWNISDKISVLIGKSSLKGKVDIDLKESIYSNLIEEQHAVLNYAGGIWYVEDLSIDNGINIQKHGDSTQYTLVKNSPCSIKRGDVLFIAKTKLLLK